MTTRHFNPRQIHLLLFLVALHVLCWVVFLSLPAVFNPGRQGDGFRGLVAEISSAPRWTNALLLIGVFYVNYLYAVPRLYFRRRYVLFAATTAAFFITFWLLNNLQHPSPVPGGPWLPPSGNRSNLFMLLIVYLVSFVLSLTALWQRVREERWKKRMAMITDRLSPHILFNTLNSIYALSLSKSEEVPGAIVRLSQTLRYTMREEENVVPLEEEISFLRNYAELEKLRLPPGADFSLTTDKVFPEIPVQRFLLISLIENAFRCSAMADVDVTLNINIRLVDNELVVCVKCNAVPGMDAGVAFAETQLRAQFELLYPANYSLEFTCNGPIFVATLRVRLS